MVDYQGPRVDFATSAVNTTLVLSSTSTKPCFLRAVYVRYSSTAGTPVVTVTLNAGAGAAYDTLMNTISIAANNQGAYIPTTPIPLAAGDVVDVSAAGVAAITSSIMIYTDRGI